MAFNCHHCCIIVVAQAALLWCKRKGIFSPLWYGTIVVESCEKAADFFPGCNPFQHFPPPTTSSSILTTLPHSPIGMLVAAAATTTAAGVGDVDEIVVAEMEQTQQVLM